MTVRKRVKRVRAGSAATLDEDTVVLGSGNVFRDLGLPDADAHLAKSRLAIEIKNIIDAKGWTQAEAGRRLGTSQPTMSLLRRGRLSSITYDKLLEWLVVLGRSVEIRVGAPGRRAHVEVAVAPPQ